MNIHNTSAVIQRITGIPGDKVLCAAISFLTGGLAGLVTGEILISVIVGAAIGGFVEAVNLVRIGKIEWVDVIVTFLSTAIAAAAGAAAVLYALEKMVQL